MRFLRGFSGIFLRHIRYLRLLTQLRAQQSHLKSFPCVHALFRLKVTACAPAHFLADPLLPGLSPPFRSTLSFLLSPSCSLLALWCLKDLCLHLPGRHLLTSLASCSRLLFSLEVSNIPGVSPCDNFPFCLSMECSILFSSQAHTHTYT